MIPLEHFRTIDYVHVREGRLVYLQVQDKTIWLKTSEASLVEAIPPLKASRDCILMISDGRLFQSIYISI